ncbi:hypothetical protein AKUH3B111A_09330 [Apilactobacillus kunkeei]|nr:hypothetical protein AKUH3B103M_09360 [Apilactobacillus kunkeei]CAI2618277.1 hypothetical protein AKUH3B104X_09360 [Apilactobacillus kunkeei]CAI2621997.1 hypothetical protein AKUH3B111A_09330 [Apilactobacillus kunkeei]
MKDITLYHSTSSENAKLIKQNGFKSKKESIGRLLGDNRSKLKKPGTLGYGTYGFLEDYELSKEFYLSNNRTDCSILEFKINLNEENILDLNNVDDLKTVRHFFQNSNMDRHLEILKRKFGNDENSQKSVFGALLEFFINHGEKSGEIKVEAVSATTSTYISKFPLSKKIPNGIEYCIRNDDLIKTKNINICKC